MRVQDPVVRTKIEQIAVRNWLPVARLNLSLLRPVSHARLQFEIVVHGLVVELFLLNLLTRQLEILIHPVQDIEAANRRLKQINVDNACHNVNRHVALQLHYVLVKLLRAKT